jgi:hypothetical protein
VVTYKVRAANPGDQRPNAAGLCCRRDRLFSISRSCRGLSPSFFTSYLQSI